MVVGSPNKNLNATEAAMFGIQGGEVDSKKGYMKDAQHPFLRNFDCFTITTVGQLSSMVKMRSSAPEKQAQQDVDAWMKDKNFSSIHG
jgi:hypothetical protein